MLGGIGDDVGPARARRTSVRVCDEYLVNVVENL